MNRLHGLCLLAAGTLACRGQGIVLPTTRDVWLSSYPSERHFNMGAAPKLKLKIHQEFALLDVDPAALGHKTVREAWLYVKPAGGHKFGLNGNTDLSWLVVSTVSHDWVEGASTRYAEDHQGHGATFLESSFGRTSWGWPGATVCDVTLGNGNSLRGHGRLEPVDEGWMRMPLDIRLVRALRTGASHGLLVQDGATYVLVNCFIASRESGDGPYIRVIPGPEERTVPRTPGNLRVEAARGAADSAHGALTVALTVPPNTFSFDVMIDDDPVARWQIPFAAAAGERQSFIIRDLPPTHACALRIRAVSSTGVAGPWDTVLCNTSAALDVPVLPVIAAPATAFARPPSLGDSARVWAAPPVTKVDPVTGEVRHESGSGNFRGRNPVWDAASRTVRLHAARGGIASFQMIFEGTVREGRVQLSTLSGPEDKLHTETCRQWRNWYVGREAEFALPIAGPVRCPWPDNELDGQTAQGVTLALPIPANQPPGIYIGTVSLTDGPARLQLPLRLRVHRARIPEQIHFNPELNAYGGPGRAGNDKFRDSFRLAHFHRCTINRVPYSQRGHTHEDWAPVVTADGHVADWRPFDEGLHGLLDGSWFRGNPRDGVPVPTLYLPLSPSFPLDVRKHYTPGEGVPVNPADPEDLLRHDALAPPPEQALSAAYGEAFRRCAREFRDHLSTNGWTRTLFEFYLNNKPKYGYTPWTLDEPVKYRDWAALNTFGRWFREGVDDPAVHQPGWHRRLFAEGLKRMSRPRATLLFRADVSRPQWQGSVSDGVVNLMVCNNGIFQYRRLVQAHKERMPTTLYCYGSCNDVTRANWETVAWCLKAYAHGADGVIPWQSLAGGDALRKADTNGLIVDAGRYGHAVASLRVHALREGAELCELLRLVQLRQGWTREQVRLLLERHLDLGSSFEQQREDEAAAVTFRSLDSHAFITLKVGLLTWLDQPKQDAPRKE